jgi:hypothetical protein
MGGECAVGVGWECWVGEGGGRGAGRRPNDLEAAAGLDIHPSVRAAAVERSKSRSESGSLSVRLLPLSRAAGAGRAVQPHIWAAGAVRANL